jgi:hypothetical protein
MRYINLCRPTPAPTPPPTDVSADVSAPPISRYELYKETFHRYNTTEHRKEFMKAYNKKYRNEHSMVIECECGVAYKDISKYSHKKSKHHKKWLDGPDSK